MVVKSLCWVDATSFGMLSSDLLLWNLYLLSSLPHTFMNLWIIVLSKKVRFVIGERSFV